MVEVFKTNVSNPADAQMLLDQIHETFVGYAANFDLEDSDKILRVKCSVGLIQPEILIGLLKNFGYDAQVLPDEEPFPDLLQGKSNDDLLPTIKSNV